jgi:hypothetical protein
VTDVRTPRHWTPSQRARYAAGVGTMALAALGLMAVWIARPDGRSMTTWLLAAVMVVGFAVAHAGLAGRRATVVLLAASGTLSLVLVLAALVSPK